MLLRGAVLALAAPCALGSLVVLLLALRRRCGAPEPRPRCVWSLLCEVPGASTVLRVPGPAVGVRTTWPAVSARSAARPCAASACPRETSCTTGSCLTG